MGNAKMRLVTGAERTPERERLAAAVDRHQTAIELLARIRSAHAHAEESLFAALTALAAAEAALAEAQANEADHLVAKALGETDAASPVALAAADVERAKADRDVIRNTIAALEARQTATASEIEKARYALDDAVKATLQAETTSFVTDLLRKAEEMQRELINERVVLKHLLHSDGIAEPLAQEVKSFLHKYHLPATYGCVLHENYDAHPAADQWRATREALRVDADAPLPA